jgi:hypothetical protein
LALAESFTGDSLRGVEFDFVQATFNFQLNISRTCLVPAKAEAEGVAETVEPKMLRASGVGTIEKGALMSLLRHRRFDSGDWVLIGLIGGKD